MAQALQDTGAHAVLAVSAAVAVGGASHAPLLARGKVLFAHVGREHVSIPRDIVEMFPGGSVGCCTEASLCRICLREHLPEEVEKSRASTLA